MSDAKIEESSKCPSDTLDEAKKRFGSWLKGVREGTGLSLEAVAHETKINKNYLLSLESGDLGSLPGKVFGRGFVKCVTRLLKTDGAEGLRLYDACWGNSIITATPEPEDNTVEAHKTKSVMSRIAEPINTSSPVTKRLMGGGFSPVGERPRLPSLRGSRDFSISFGIPNTIVRSFVSPYVRLWVLGGLVTLFAGLVFGRWAASHWHKARLVGNNATEAVVAASTSAPTQMAELSATPSKLTRENTPGDILEAASSSKDLQVTPAGIATKSSLSPSVKPLAKNEDESLYLPSETPSAFEQVLEINVANPVEIRLSLDGKKLENTWFKADSYRFTFNTLAELYLLDASEVDIVYNGRSLGVLGNKGRKRRIYFQAKAAASDFPQ